MPRESSSGLVSAWGTGMAQGDQPRITPTSGTLYVPRHVASTMTLSAAGMAVQGFTLTQTAVLDRVRFRVTTGVSGNATVAIYGSTAQSAPASLIASGTADVTSIGFKSVTFSERLVPGTYWVGVMASTAAATVYGEAASSSAPTAASPRNAGNWDNLVRAGAYNFAASSSGTPDTNPTWGLTVFDYGVVTIEVRFA